MKFFESKSLKILSEGIKGRNNEDRWSYLWYIFILGKFNKTLAGFIHNILYN
jgi:XTP/dITP diphosphohydrolase